MNKGVIVVNKPIGWTSFDVVNKIRQLLKIKRVGHLGTLDPMATGVLLVTFGSATKLFDIMQEKQKSYIAEFELNKLTDTLDSTGNILKTDNTKVSKNDLECVVNSFVGRINQIPPQYSAKSISGVRAYDLARRNIDFELSPKLVEIYEIKLIEFCESSNRFKISVSCSSGTYIRALGRDIAQKLNTYATMTNLVRTKVGKFEVDNAVDMANLTDENIINHCITIDDLLDFERIDLDENQTKKILNGQILKINKKDAVYKLNNDYDTIALINVKENFAKMSVFLG